MIAFLPIREQQLVQALAQKEGVSASFGYAVFENNAPAAYVLYEICGEEGVLVCIGGEYDRLIAEGLIRAVFSSLYDANILRARFLDGIPDTLTHSLGFTKDDSRVVESIADVLFHCGCEKCH